MRVKLLAGKVIGRRKPNLRRIVMVVLCGIRIVLVPAKDSTIFKQFAVPVDDVLIKFSALKNCVLRICSDGQCNCANCYKVVGHLSNHCRATVEGCQYSSIAAQS